MGYSEVDPAVFARNNEIAQSRRTGSGADYWKPQVGPPGQPKRNVIRIMPPHENMGGDAFVAVKMHFLPSKELGRDNRPIPITINCLSEYGKDCGACRHADALFKQAKGEDDPETQAQIERQAKDQAAKIRVFVNVVDIDHPEKGVVRYAFPPDVEKTLRMCFHDDDGNFRNITHPKTGRDVLLFVQKRAGTDFNDYKGTKAKDAASAIKDMDWLDQISDLSELKVEPTPDDVTKALRGERPKSALPTAQKPAAAAAAPPAAKPKPAAAPPAAAKPAVAATKPKRQPVQEEEAPATESDDPWAVGRAACAEAGFSEAAEITPEDVEKIKKPNCYTKEADPTDSMCQGCRVLLPCLTAKLAAVAA